jgi:hypothetical protein
VLVYQEIISAEGLVIRSGGNRGYLMEASLKDYLMRRFLIYQEL